MINRSDDIFTGQPDSHYVEIAIVSRKCALEGLSRIWKQTHVPPKLAISLILQALSPLDTGVLLDKFEKFAGQNDTAHVEEHHRAYALIPWYAAITDFCAQASELLDIADNEGASLVPHADVITMLSNVFHLSDTAANSATERNEWRAASMYRQIQNQGLTKLLSSRILSLIQQIYPQVLEISHITPTDQIVTEYSNYLYLLFGSYLHMIGSVEDES